MKIICAKCNNEFFINKDNDKRNFYTVRCPVCKNTITIRVDSNDVSQHRVKYHSGSSRYTSNADADPQTELSKINESRGKIEDFSDRDRYLSAQIQDAFDNEEFESDEKTYDNLWIIGEKKQLDIMSKIKAYFRDIDPYSFIERYLSYGYYLYMLFFIFMSLFFFSEIIKYDNVGFSIDCWLHSLINNFRQHM